MDFHSNIVELQLDSNNLNNELMENFPINKKAVHIITRCFFFYSKGKLNVLCEYVHVETALYAELCVLELLVYFYEKKSNAFELDAITEILSLVVSY